MKGPTWVDSCQPGLILVMVAKKRQLKASLRKPAAAYDLSMVREILRCSSPNVRWVFRKGGQNDFEKLGFTESQALGIVRSLRPKDFDMALPPLPKQNSQPADVYKIQRPDTSGKLRTLYVKFQVREAKEADQSDQLVIISFHD